MSKTSSNIPLNILALLGIKSNWFCTDMYVTWSSS